MRLTDYLRRELVTLDLPDGDANAVLEALGQRLSDAGVVDDPDTVVEALKQREAAHTTALGGGVAIPHCTLATVAEPVLLVAVAPHGAEFGPPESEPVRLFFLLLSPPERAQQHIRILARLVRILRDPGIIERLQEAETAEALVREIESLDAQQAG